MNIPTVSWRGVWAGCLGRCLDYGAPTLYNVLFLGDVGDNVQYAPIFAGRPRVGRIRHSVVGNGHRQRGPVRRAVSDLEIARGRLQPDRPVRRLLDRPDVRGKRLGATCRFRAITSHADIAIAAKGFGVSTWALFPFLIVPALYVVYHFFHKMVPRCLGTLAAGSSVDRALVIALTAYWFFAFFGGDGTDGSYGLVVATPGHRLQVFPVPGRGHVADKPCCRGQRRISRGSVRPVRRNRRVDHQLQAQVVVRLEARMLEGDHALRRVVQRLDA